MKSLINCRIVLPDRILDDHMILFDTKIRAIQPADASRSDLTYVDGRGLYAMPGLIDIHSHGCVGEDTTTSSAEGIRRMCRAVAKDGVTAWLPTTMSYPLPALRQVFANLRSLREESEKDPSAWGGAQILGVNMEGPFISRERRGAHKEEYIVPPEREILLENADLIRLVTIAPEAEGAMDLIRELQACPQMHVSVGHTTIGYDAALEAFDAGARHVTHLFNAMTGIHHRDPGLAGAALTRNDVYCELIADTFHIHRGLFPMIAACKKDHLILITDSMRAAGLPEGTYDLGGQQVRVQGIRCLLPNGTIAGSVLRLNQAVHNLVENTDWDLPHAVAAASLHPARAIGLAERKGSIEPGKDADLILADAGMQVYETYVRGEQIYASDRMQRL